MSVGGGDEGNEDHTCNESVVRKVQGRIIGHFYGATIRIFAVSQELVDGIEGVRLYGIVGGEDNEHGNIRLKRR
jgi:hypothetical protein